MKLTFSGMPEYVQLHSKTASRAADHTRFGTTKPPYPTSGIYTVWAQDGTAYQQDKGAKRLNFLA